VFVSVLGGEQARAATLLGLTAAHGVLQSAIAHELSLKRTPQLTFEYDPSVEQGVRMTKLIDDLAPQSVDTEHDERADDH
jgi:ribosome-binding factor A